MSTLHRRSPVDDVESGEMSYGATTKPQQLKGKGAVSLADFWKIVIGIAGFVVCAMYVTGVFTGKGMEKINVGGVSMLEVKAEVKAAEKCWTWDSAAECDQEGDGHWLCVEAKGAEEDRNPTGKIGECKEGKCIIDGAALADGKEDLVCDAGSEETAQKQLTEGADSEKMSGDLW